MISASLYPTERHERELGNGGTCGSHKFAPAASLEPRPVQIGARVDRT